MPVDPKPTWVDTVNKLAPSKVAPDALKKLGDAVDAAVTTKAQLTGIMGRWEHFRGQSVNSLRWSRNTMTIVEGGWHFTSMGSLDYLIRKVRGFAHTELVSETVDEQLAHCWTHGHDLAGDWFTQIDDLSVMPEWVNQRKFPAEWYRLRP